MKSKYRIRYFSSFRCGKEYKTSKNGRFRLGVFPFLYPSSRQLKYRRLSEGMLTDPVSEYFARPFDLESFLAKFSVFVIE